MTAIAFYHLEQSSLEQALPKLLEKTISLGKRALVLAGSDQRVESLAQVLWTYDAASWLPHGSKKDGNPDDQPIWISTEAKALNGASFLFMTDGVDCDELQGFERCFDLFDGHDEAAVLAARGRWKKLKEAGHDLAYWQQDADGRWSQKA